MLTIRKKILYGIITFVLAVLFVTSLALRVDPRLETVETVSGERLLSATTEGLAAAPAGEAVRFEGAGTLELTLSGRSIDAVTVRFEGAVPDLPEGQVTAVAGDQKMSASGHTDPDDPTLCTFYLVECDCERVSLRLSGSVTISEITTAHTTKGSVARRANPIPLVLLGVGAVLLVVFDRKIGYCSAVAAALRGCVATVRNDLRENRAKGVLRLCAVLFTAIWGLSILFLLLTSAYSKGAVFLTFSLAVLAILAQFAHRVAGNGNGSPAAMFAVLALIFGVTMATILPPITLIAWDDETHFHRVMEVVEVAPKTVSLAERRLFSNAYWFGWFQCHPSGMVRMLMLEGAVPEQHQGVNFRPYEIFGYVPAILTNGLARLLRADLITLFLLGRVATSVFYGVTVSLGLRRLKYGGYAVAAACLLPSVLFLASSYSYDPWLMAWTAFGFCVLLSEWQQPEKPMGKRERVLLLVSMILACAPKAVYFVLFFPIFFFRKEKFASEKERRNFRLAGILAMLFIAATFLLPFAFGKGGYTDTRGGTDVSATGQMKFIFSHPLQYTRILLQFLGFYVSAGQAETFNVAFGYLGFGSAFFGTVSLFLFLYAVCTDHTDGDHYETMRAPRYTGLFACFAALALVATTLYLAFTPVGHETVLGCQFRYLFPILIPFGMFVVPAGIRSGIPRKVQNCVVFGGSFLCLVATLGVVYLRAYF